MYSDEAKKAVEEVIVDFVTNQKLFTAYDVTREARKKTTDNIAHNIVRHFVWSYLQANYSNYVRDLVTLNLGMNPSVFVYHADTQDAYDYHLALKQDNDIPDSDDGTVDDDSDDADDGVGIICTITKEKRLNIPNKILGQANAVNGKYKIIVKNDTYNVDKNRDGRVRVFVDATPYQKVTVSYDNDENVINVNF